MSTTAFHISPAVRVFNKRSESFVQSGPGSAWHRLTAEDEAKRAIVCHNRDTREPSVGIYVIRTSSGRVKVGFDLWRLSANLTEAVVTRLGGSLAHRRRAAVLEDRPSHGRSQGALLGVIRDGRDTA